MTKTKNNDIIELYKVRIDLIHKKLLVWLALGAGSGAYGIKFIETGNFKWVLFFIFVFSISSIGVSVNYYKLSKIDKKLIELEKEKEDDNN